MLFVLTKIRKGFRSLDGSSVGAIYPFCATARGMETTFVIGGGGRIWSARPEILAFSSCHPAPCSCSCSCSPAPAHLRPARPSDLPRSAPVRPAYLPYRIRSHLEAQGSSIFFRILYPHPPRVRRFLGKSTFPREGITPRPYSAPLYIASGLPPCNALTLSTFSYVDNVWKNF